jgi:F-box protein 18 (helicase)
MSVTPTTEQSTVASTALASGQIMLVNAYAGTGKTETLRLLAEANLGKRLLYLSFNKQTAVKAARRFPHNTACRTVHSLAYASVGNRYKGKLGNPTPRDVIQRFGIQQPYIAVLAINVVTSYCHSTDRLLSEQHIERRLQIKYPEVLPLAHKVWAEMQDLGSQICMSHDGYLKLWSLGLPRISADIIMLDEAQDTNPVTLKILLDQLDNGSSGLVLVGDSHQAIYSWRKAINSMEQVRERADFIYPLTVSFRFNQQIATNASKILNYYKGDPVQIIGHGPSTSALPPFAVIGRCNGSLLARAIPVVEKGGTVHFAGTSEKEHWDPYYLYELQIPLDLLYLKQNQREGILTPQIRAFSDYKEVVDQIKGDGQGAGIDKELEKHVKLVDEYGERLPDLIDRLRRRSRSPETADLSLSTAHRAKGLEWRRVEMLDDFAALQGEPESGTFDSEYLEEMNLIYVAMTRAAESIEYPADIVAWLSCSLHPG